MLQQKSLDLSEAQELVDAAVAVATSRELLMAFTVVDTAGHTIISLRMDGANWMALDISRAKAFAAAGWRAHTGAIQSGLETNAPFLVTAAAASTQGRFMPQRGAAVLRFQGQVVGAIGASGGTGMQDEDVVFTAIGGRFEAVQSES
jgi:uncharacterized protein GlcG (DUF336 family)